VNALLVILQLLIACSGLPLLFILGHRAWRSRRVPVWSGFAAYAALSAFMLMDAALLAAYQIEELHLLMVQRPGAAMAALDAVILAKTMARVGLAFLGLALCRQVAKRPIAAWWYLLPAAWAVPLLAQAFGVVSLPAALPVSLVADLVPLAAWAAYLLLTRRHWGALVLIALVGLGESIAALAEALAPQALPATATGWLAQAAFLALNAGLYRHFVLGAPANATATPGKAKLAEAGLSLREREVAARLARLASYKEIASELCISSETVKSHAKAVYRKTGCRDRTDLMKRFELPS
jgi:DNA-binding CsgD family transcriptional regulator